MGLCDGSGTLAPHPATMGADAGVDDPCPCRDVAACDSCEFVYGAGLAAAPCRHQAPTVSPLESAWAEVDAAVARARLIGPRPMPPSEPRPMCVTCGIRENEFGDLCARCDAAEEPT